jgi:hypothetical protein
MCVTARGPSCFPTIRLEVPLATRTICGDLSNLEKIFGIVFRRNTNVLFAGTSQKGGIDVLKNSTIFLALSAWWSVSPMSVTVLNMEVIMKIRQILMLFIASAGMLAVPGNLPAQDSVGFWGRLNPFRRHVSQSRTTPETVQPGRSDAQLANLREQLAQRGLTQAQVDARIDQILTAKQGAGGVRPFSTPTGQPSLEDIRAHLISRGVDPVKIDARIERTMTAGAHGRANAAMRRGLIIGDTPVDVPVDAPTTLPVGAPTGTPDVGTSPVVPEPTVIDPVPVGSDTATSSAPIETPVQTTTSPQFRTNARGLRGGFGRGRTRTR